MNRLFLMLLVGIILGCKNEKVKFIECRSSIDSDSIKTSNSDHGILTLKSLNHKYHINSSFPLIYKDSFPDWIADYEKPTFSIKEYKFEPKIYDIDAPYVLFKQKNDCYFSIIKNGDTLKFKMEK